MPSLLDTSLPGFRADAASPRAILIIVHGLAEYAGRYRPIMEELARRGISSLAYDQRGHGEVAGTRTHVDRFDDFVDDLNLLIRAVRAAHPQLPLFLWGHSMGTLVALLAASDPQIPVRGVITTSNSLEIFRRGTNPLNPFFRFLSWLVPRVRIPLGLDSTRISTDESVQRAYASDPRIPPTASLRLIVEFAAACEDAREAAATITLPSLVVHGEEDAIAPAEGSRALFGLLAATDKKLQIYPGLRHEVHNEVPAARQQFVDLLTGWILQRS
ncbi:lysophospholipase [Povalibacter uvarum]|uniref:Lysophospholipase n=1 Tax=Povalibacter uvarum TaxID=732238 RepID=A0A841HLS2_9GAMM|nr:alpha/beta hydrolase [Povalibacter uvarum]MBB6093544.1 lysophospholipase [Povalibacter uvarum]